MATKTNGLWNAGTTINVVANGTAQFAPGVFWLHASAAPLVTNGEPFTCSGYNAAVAPPLLLNCSGISTAPPAGATISTGSMEVAGAVLNRGFIKIEMQNNATPPVWIDVTSEILKLGISGPANTPPATQAAPNPICDPTPFAVVRLQHLRDNLDGVCVIAATGNSTINSNDYWPNVLYDTREGIYRDTPPANPVDHNLYLGGMMNYVALDVNNLRRWLAGTAAPFLGLNGINANNQNGAGFIVYFSDRRNNKCPVGSPSCPGAAAPVETGEYGFEDNVNPLAATGLPANNVLDLGEDVNAIVPVAPAVYVPVQDIYGEIPPVALQIATVPAGMMDANAHPWTVTQQQWVGMINRPMFFRRALKLVNGGNANATTSSLPSPGLAVASENPVYVQGNYNATVGTAAAGVVATETHVAASILADAVTLLSNSWNDSLSFHGPTTHPQRGSPSGEWPRRPPTGLRSSPAKVFPFRGRPPARPFSSLALTAASVTSCGCSKTGTREPPRFATAARSSACSSAVRRPAPTSTARASTTTVSASSSSTATSCCRRCCRRARRCSATSTR